MKQKQRFFIAIILAIASITSAKASTGPLDSYQTTVVFPAGFQIGDFVEFVGVSPIRAGSSGYFEISISYVRGNIAAAATHLAAISHANPDVWKETGRINNNKYVDGYLNFTIDCNAQYFNPRFRIRAVNNFGVLTDQLEVNVIVTPKNYNDGYRPMNIVGNDTSVQQFQPMTNDWNLYVGNLHHEGGAYLAIKADQNGNVGIGTATPKERLSVNGKIRSKEVMVETDNWPDYVFSVDYKLASLKDIQEYIRQNGHLPEIPSAAEIASQGQALGDINKLLLKKIEELTLILIDKEMIINTHADQLKQQQIQMGKIQAALDRLEGTSHK